MPQSTDHSMRRAYATFAPVYDFMFGPILEPGRRAAIRDIPLRRGDHVLEVGVGTGLSLASYPAGVRVTGIDLSPRMLDKAQARVGRKKLGHIEALLPMDAGDLAFESDTFDAVIAMYMISVVDDPIRVVSEMRRVCKPGKTLVIVNHFRTDSRIIRFVEAMVRPIHRAVRFRADLDLDAFSKASGLQVQSCLRTNIFGYSTVLYCRNDCDGAQAAVGSRGINA